MKRFLNYKTLLVLLLLTVGLFLRLNNLESKTLFDADQEWLAFRAKDVLSGDIVLLGPVTSVGNFSIGPGFIYLWSFFAFLTHGNPISGVYLSVSLGILTCLSIFLFAKYFIGEKVAYILLFLVSISFSFIFWDQIPWAPSLFYLSQIILLAGAYLSIKNDLGYLFLSVGFIVGFQSHFGIFLSLLPILIYFIFIRPKKPSLKILLMSFGILFIGLLPNITFDVFNNFINLKRFILIFKGDGLDYFTSLGKIIKTLAYNVSSIVYPRQINLLDSIISKGFLALLLVSGIRLLLNNKERNLSLLLLFTITIPAVFFYVQQGKFSEYYLMMTVPPLILLLGLFIKQILKRKFLIITVLIISLFLNLISLKNQKRLYNLSAKNKITRIIIEKGGKEGYGISLTTKLGDAFGFKYIFDYLKIKSDVPPKKGETKIFSVIVPAGFDGIKVYKEIDGIGLIWQGI
jgi:hypothetical protein